MNIQDAWEKALKKTQIIRSRAKSLSASGDTKLPYVFLGEAVVNKGDTIVRKGEVLVKKPSLILPSNIPHFEGFDFEEGFGSGEDMVTNFLLVRGVSFPSMKYDNKTTSLNIYEGHIDKAISYHKDFLEKHEDVSSGLIVGPEDSWQFSVLIFICMQIAKQANSDIRRIIEGFDKKGRYN